MPKQQRTGAEGSEEKEKTMTTKNIKINIKIKASQFTTAAGKDPHLRDLVRRTLNAAGIDPTGMKFSIKDGPVNPSHKGSVMIIAKDTGVHTFCRQLVHLARRIELERSGESATLSADQISRIVTDHWTEALLAIRENLNFGELEAWDKQVTKIAEAEKKAAIAAAKAKAARADRIIGSARKRSAAQSEIIDEYIKDLKSDPRRAFEWDTEKLGIAINLKHRCEMFLGYAVNNKELAAAKEANDVNKQVEILGATATEMLKETIKEVMVWKNWARSSGGSRGMDESCKAQSACEFAGWLETVQHQVDFWFERPERPRMFGFCMLDGRL